MVSSPRISIITATYNWSTALRCALQSAILQTFSEFELLVVGDGCTDDSAAVVASFGDERLRWMPLESNSGSQAIPNNHGIANASGHYIAYLGHDDVWFPTHLQSLVETMERTDADLAGGVTIMYGPPDSGVRSVTGVFATGEYSRRDFLPPSAILHTKALAGKIGPWKEPLGLCMSTDLEFQQRARAAGARIVSTGELTVFKFNAAWRRNSYLTKPTAEQEAMLARIRTGVDFRQGELIEVVRSLVGDRYVRIEVPEDRPAGEFQRANIAYKGSSKEKVELGRLESCTRFSLDNQLGGFEWHLVERLEPWGSLRWSGPSRSSTLEFPVLFDQPLAIRVHIVFHVQEDIARDVQLLVNGTRLSSMVETTDAGTTLLSAVLMCDAGEPVDQPLRITLVVAKTRRPIDLGINEDRRWLGIAVNWVELEPIGSESARA